VRSIGVEVLALLLVGIREVSALEDGSFSNGRRSTRDRVIGARVVIAESESSSEPDPLKSPSAVSKVLRYGDRDSASSRTSIGRSRVTTVRIGSVVRMASTDFVAVDLLNSSVESGVRVRVGSWSPG